MESPIKPNAERDSITYYEICMDEESPLIGGITGECVDLREELDSIWRDRPSLRFDAKVRKSDLQKLLRESRESGDDWVTVRLNLTPRPARH